MCSLCLASGVEEHDDDLTDRGRMSGRSPRYANLIFWLELSCEPEYLCPTNSLLNWDVVCLSAEGCWATMKRQKKPSSPRALGSPSGRERINVTTRILQQTSRIPLRKLAPVTTGGYAGNPPGMPAPY